MWETVDGAPIDLIEEGVSQHREGGGIGPDGLDRLDRHIRDHYSTIRSHLPEKYELGLPSDKKLQGATQHVGKIAFTKIDDIERLKIDIVESREDVSKTDFFEYIGLRVLQNGSGDLFDRIF